jgi:hypothetical protein
MATPDECPMVHTEGYEGIERRQWHLDKTVSLSHIFTTVTIVVSVAVVLSKFDTRVTVLEQAVEYQKVTNNQHTQSDIEIKHALKDGLEKIDSKLDKLIWSKK